MTADVRDPFRELEPPPGGAERFGRRLAHAARPARRGPGMRSAPAAALAVAGTLAVAVAMLAWLVDAPREGGAPAVPTVRDVYEARAFDRLLGRSHDGPGLAVTIDDEAASVAEVESANDKIRIYQLN